MYPVEPNRREHEIHGVSPNRLKRMTVVLVFTGLFLAISPFNSSAQNAYASASPELFRIEGIVPLGIVPDPDNNKLYLINYNKSIAVVEENSPHKIIALINHPEYEEGEFSFANLALNNETDKLYIVADNSMGIYVIDGKTDTIVKRIELSAWGVSIALNPVTNKIYVFGYGEILYVIDGFTDEIEDTLDVGQYIRTTWSPYESHLITPEIVVNPNTNVIYTLHHLSDLILAINGTTNEIIGNTTAVERPYAMLFNPAVDKLYISGNAGPLTILDASSLQTITTIGGVGYAGAIPSFWRGISSDGRSIFATAAGENIAVIDGEEDRIVGGIQGQGLAIWGFSSSDAAGRIYVTFDGFSSVQIIDPMDFDSDAPDNATDDGIEVISSVFIQVENRTYSMVYHIDNGGSITDISTGPADQSVLLSMVSPKAGYLDLTFPRELFDHLRFTDHEVVAFVDEMDAGPEILGSSSCDKISLRIPIQQQSETVEITHSDPAGSHYDPYPARLTLERALVAEGEEFHLELSTDAVKCDISFVKEEKKLHIVIESNPLLSEGERGYFAIAIPRELIGGNYTVLINGQPSSDVQIFTTALEGLSGADPNISTIAFSYDRIANSVDIVGTEVIPEFGSALSLVAIAGAMLTGSLFLRYRVKH